ncbi:MAG: cobalamin biosynthesis protein CbiA, partial [candidate division Zixibacteria bacterium]|nr:cobalamin biosynthesis protein CbiA [candidate division Zixibacteria bacterium]
NYEMLMVLNSRRPFTETVAGCRKVMTRIEQTARMKFTGLISNSHMIQETTPDLLQEGYQLAQAVGRDAGLPLFFISAQWEVLKEMDLLQFDCPILPLTRSMLKPWERKSGPVGL